MKCLFLEALFLVRSLQLPTLGDSAFFLRCRSWARQESVPFLSSETGTLPEYLRRHDHNLVLPLVGSKLCSLLEAEVREMSFPIS